MKRFIVLLLITVLLSSCSVQDKMNAELFTERFGINNKENEFITDEVLYCNNTAKIYLKDKNKKDYLMEIYSDSFDNVYKITLTSDALNNEFYNLCKKIIKSYSSDTDAEKVFDEMFKNDSDYAETQWYYISSVKKDGIVFFSIDNKKLSPEKNTELTLKINDITTTKGSE